MNCPSCGAENRVDARFCDACGATLAVEASRAVRKVVTVLFCDVTGSTALGERLDPETLRVTMAQYYAIARAAIERHGGTVEKFIGDAVMAVFGVPIVREDDALRAVRAAVELRDTTDLDVRIGVNTGEVVTGTGETLVTGDAVNVAARLEQAAGSGEILVGAETYRLVRDAVEVDEVAPVAAKGKSEPVLAYLLRVVTGEPAYRRRFDAPFVGRDRERRLLGDAWERCRSESACALFSVLGSAGVGKSRLVAEFLDGVDATVVSGRCLSYGEGITYWPVVEVVKQLLGEEAPPNAALAAVLGDGSVATDDIALAVRRLLESKAREHPLVVTFDDVHWAEPTFLDLIEHVADWSRDAPILLLCVARPELLERRAGWGGGKLNATTALLEPLNDDEADVLIDELLAGVDLEPRLRVRIREAAGGNPLFVEQMLAMVQAAPDEEISVPPTIQALLAARLDQLPDGERGALERGAVEGQVFHRGAVQALAPDDASIPAQLLGLVRKELVRPTTPMLPDDDAFRFRHLLIRDAAYDALPKSQRAALHERFSVWLEEHGGSIVELDEILGYHLEQAARYRSELGQDSTRLALAAGARLTAAGRRAVFRSDFVAGRGLLARAAALLEDTPERMAALPWLGDCMYSLGEYAAADALLTEAVDGATGDDAAIAFFLRAGGRGHNPTEGESLASLEEAVRVRLADLGDDASDLAFGEGYQTLARLRFWLGSTDGMLEAATRAREHAQRAGVTSLEASASTSMGTALMYGASPWADYEAFGSALLADRDRLGHVAANVRGGLAMAAAYQLRFEESAQIFEQFAADLLERGNEVGLRSISQNRAYARQLAGDLDAAESIYREAWDAYGELGERGFRSTVGGLLALTLLELGRRAEAEAIAAESAELAPSDDWLTAASLAAVEARIATDDGRHDDAVAAARRAVEIGNEGYILLAPWWATELGRALAAAGRAEEARGTLEEAMRLARAKGSAVYELRAQALLDDLGR